MNKLLWILTILFAANGFAQDKFIINEYSNKDGLPSVNKSKIRVNKDHIFEDSVYIVSKTCRGEFGGTIKFTNKKTGIVYWAASTCPVVVNKLNGKYYVTNTLVHLSGFSQVIEIAHPDSMEVFQLPEPRSKNGKPIARYVGYDESMSTKGTRSLADTHTIIILASFPYNGQLYHILTDFKKTVLAKIENRQFVTIDTVSEKSLRTYKPEVFVTAENHRIVLFDNPDVKGHLDIFENRITVVRKNKKKRPILHR
jgi:hypothetical protein